MNNRKEFGQGIFFMISNHIYWLTLTNIYFVLCNTIFLFFFMALEPVFSNLIIIFLALIPTGPAIMALCYVMDKLVRDKEISPTRDFFYGYKVNFKDTLKVWIPMLALLFILIVDLQYFYAESTVINQVLSIVFLVALIVLICLSLYVFPITAKFKFRIRDVYKLSIYYSFKKLKISFGNIGIIIIALFFMFITSNFLILFIAGALCYLLTLNSKDIIEDIKLNYTK
ncbi:YesL family protein [Lederbergia lenta]|uniref:Predicted integral membrane protein n=1 Tax=Lederbergia lenta TaxID=1467 RepID=A0A2X4VP82_LEDLE|nr:YesL family protein [Lederbergia lenta]MCM3110908.1 YesL family protein [Lederbergia lenta]MEC2325696.1 YesL family protein [Lederbergia lenta]SQI53926.1 Predicted integral membrane protein [Lederbergia lenta]